MHLVLLRFSHRKAEAPRYMEGHKAWLQRGFEEGAFLLSGSLEGGQGGLLLANGQDADALLARVNQDPFVIEGVVSADIVAVSPNRAAPRLEFLIPKAAA
ncbi:hypothetical protein [Hydrogenophaga laconesensis]|uniref:Uncharacterized protein YciI n=1 Tax=Hydrogenophaga laconesensis TaxID=1805971 RepID=A0ABU1VE30_9BURK|nr:hypothetical protein [Hydrogenophaga laconesensis]MDR7095733.1 uncharacterized protein YciI [Hydrogenophaga laconesensis]